MRRVGWVIVGRGDSREVWHPFLETAARTNGAAVRKWCAPMQPLNCRKHWRYLRKTGRAKLVRIYVKEDRT